MQYTGCPTPTVHIVALWSAQSAAVSGPLYCWMEWINHMIATDNNTSYRLHVLTDRTPAARREDSINFLSASWLRAVRGKISLALQTLHSFRQARCQAFVFTDLDILPLRPFGQLVQVAGSNGHAELHFMKEPSWSDMGYVNSGFIVVLNNSAAVRRLFREVSPAFLSRLQGTAQRTFPSVCQHDCTHHENLRLIACVFAPLQWATTTRPGMRNQGVINKLLGCQNSTAMKSHTIKSSDCPAPRQAPAWAVLSEDQVTGTIGDVGSRTVAYHAIGVGSSLEKNRLMWRAHRRAAYPLGASRWCDTSSPPGK